MRHVFRLVLNTMKNKPSLGHFISSNSNSWQIEAKEKAHNCKRDVSHFDFTTILLSRPAKWKRSKVVQEERDYDFLFGLTKLLVVASYEFCKLSYLFCLLIVMADNREALPPSGSQRWVIKVALSSFLLLLITGGDEFFTPFFNNAVLS